MGREMAAQLVRAGHKVGIAGRRGELLNSFIEEHKSIAAEPIEAQVLDVTAPDATAALPLIAHAPTLFVLIKTEAFD